MQARDVTVLLQVMRATYIVAFYLSDDAEKNLLEDHQSMLEQHLEQLHHQLETQVDKVKSAIVILNLDLLAWILTSLHLWCRSFPWTHLTSISSVLM